MQKIRIGIVGYGNLGRGVELALEKCPDMELVGVFTRRDPAKVSLCTADANAFGMDAVSTMKGRIDVMILCGGSATDLPEQGPALAADFTTVDSFDTHAKIPAYFAAVDQAARAGGNLSIISVGWDPGLFSLNRLYAEAILPDGDSYTFWGRGVSQGHSDAIRRVDGVENGVQYTIPLPSAIEAVRSGARPQLSTREKHARECYVVAKEGADREQIRRTICEMPNYFADYETTVHFITSEQLAKEHAGMPHGGFVMRSGSSGHGHSQLIEYALTLESNPEFTASVLVSYARAAHRMRTAGELGARSVLEVAPALLSPKSPEALRAELL